ncbi:hypothetical protein [Marinoscillum sp. MHG1-6]|uniref:hypothetical protein n=1 Tax=Marinoscillum sp. MHG1-6 TaxID=2959627 RepID=UPI00215879F7|nr:hypothetical protein [Marinoscillum sp. MHG1-6]
MEVKFSYQTLTTPPPYAFAYTLELEISKSKVKVQFDLEYVNREELTDEEILSEGFTKEDDVSWTGELESIWGDYLTPLIDKIELIPQSEDVDTWLHVEVNNGSTKSGLVKDLVFWDYQLQEVIQAIYESAKFEHPLKIQLLHNAETNVYFEMEGSFGQRSASVNKKSISWENFQALLNAIYNIDESKKPANKPNKKGLWIDINNDQSWFQVQGEIGEILSILNHK